MLIPRAGTVILLKTQVKLAWSLWLRPAKGRAKALDSKAQLRNQVLQNQSWRGFLLMKPRGGEKSCQWPSDEKEYADQKVKNEQKGRETGDRH